VGWGVGVGQVLWVWVVEGWGVGGGGVGGGHPYVGGGG
jgi:hypothetical protein